MRPDILILRPEPGAGETATRAEALGLHAAVTPLFNIVTAEWDIPNPASFDAVLLTSANAARWGGEGLKGLSRLRCYAVGEASAAAAAEAGFHDVRVGSSDGAAVLDLIAGAGKGRILHLCGRDHIALGHPRLRIERRIVYAAEAAGELPVPARLALEQGALALLHSPRAAALFRVLVDQAELQRGRIRLAAISEAAGAAAGTGWKSKDAAAYPRDQALLELALKLCKADASAMGPEE